MLDIKNMDNDDSGLPEGGITGGPKPEGSTLELHQVLEACRAVLRSGGAV